MKRERYIKETYPEVSGGVGAIVDIEVVVTVHMQPGEHQEELVEDGGDLPVELEEELLEDGGSLEADHAVLVPLVPATRWSSQQAIFLVALTMKCGMT